jgi:hypothetical protein
MMRFRISIICLFLCFVSAGQAQNTIDPARKKNNIGFILGGNYSMAEQVNQSRYQPNEESGYGFGVGIGGEIKLIQGLFIAPSGVFTVRDFEEMAVSAQFNANFEYKWDFGSNDPYLILGAAMDFPIEGPGLTSSFSNRYNMAMNFGLGLSHWFSSFMLAPELVYTHGFRNLNANPANDANSGLYLHQVSLYFKLMH